MMSKACTSGTPDDIMVASWRLKMAMSLGVIALPLPALARADFFLTLSGTMPCLRSSALTRVGLVPRLSPLTRLPRLSVPSQANRFSLSAFSAMALFPSVSP